MPLFTQISEYLKNFGIYTSTIGWQDILEIVCVWAIVYAVLKWMKDTRAWVLLKGILFILGFLAISYAFRLDTILWIAKNVFGVALTAIVIVLQPELRSALEDLGRSKMGLQNLFDANRGRDEELSEKTINEIVRASVEMGRVRTGALIVIEREESLKEFERTGIAVDGIVTSQLFINIFEKNTPLHDGAVIVRKNRIASATCYLPLTKSDSLSKELGTRHRAALGVSEETDSVTVIVSEETGRISLAYSGELERNLDSDRLRERLKRLLIGANEPSENGWKIGRRRKK